jgi:2-polyprenyl-3-methyl-5-hydroxy-6-metoxy-1,4-benzoquinol methylase
MLGATEVLATVAAFLRVRAEGIAMDPAVEECMDAVIDKLGVRAHLEALDEHDAKMLCALFESFLTNSASFVADPGRSSWDPEATRLLMAQGDSSVIIANDLHRFVVPSIGPDLAERLDAPGAAFLDVGVGVGSLSIAMCRHWPSLTAVGIDPWEPALALAREQVAAAGLEDRVELRPIVVQALDDAEAYDLVWVPTFFIPGTVMEEAVQRSIAALRPGGWVVLGLYARPPDPFATAVTNLRTVRYGGALHTPDELAALLTGAGFVDVDVLHEAARRRPLMYVVGRRPS